MLNFVRTHKRLMLFFTVLLIFPSFVFMGVQGFYSMGSANEVAKVGSIPISVSQYDNYYRNWIGRQTRENPQVDSQVYETPAVKEYVLGELVTTVLISLATQDARLLVTDIALRRNLENDPGIQSTRDQNGKMEPEKYLQLVQQNNFRTPKDFEDQRRVDIAKNRFAQAIVSNVYPKTDVDIEVKRLGQNYTIRQQLFTGSDYQEQVQLSDEAIKAYYEQNQNQFMAPASADIEFVVLDSEQYMNNIAISDEVVREFYEQNKEGMPLFQQRKASHILIEVDEDATQEQKIQAFTKAKDLLEQAKQDSTKFAELAKENSADEVSASKGGDIGVFGPGEMIEAFEAAAFSMNAPGVYEEVVATDEGFHVLMVTEATVKPFDELSDRVKEAAIQSIRTQKADTELSILTEDFREGVHTNPDSLAPVAEKLKLELQQAQGITLKPLPGATGILANPNFLAAVFAPQSIERKLGIQPVAVSPTEYVSARIVTYTEEHVQPFDDVKEQAAELATKAKALELASVDAQKAFEEWKKDPQAAKDSEELKISLMDPYVTKMDIAQTVFTQTSPATQLPEVLTIKLDEEGYAIVLVEKIEDETDEIKNESLETYAQAYINQKSSAAQQEAFMLYLDKKYGVKLYPDRLVESKN